MPRITVKAVKEELLAAQKANTVLNTDLAVLKTQHETLKATLAHCQKELLRYSAVIQATIDWLGTIPKAEAMSERVAILQKEVQPR